jgi:hypothetical protein
VGREDVDWIYVAEGKDKWWALVNTHMNFRVPQNAGNSWPAGELRFSRTLHDGISYQ